MNHQVLALNPKIRILHKKGVLFAGQLSGTVQAVQLLEFDIVLLHLFLGGADPQQVVRELLGGRTRALLSAVPRIETLQGRINQLSEAKILLSNQHAAHGKGNESAEPGNGLEDCAEITACDESLKLRIGANIALKPAKRAFQVWSPANRKHYYPGIELLLLLFSFLTDKTAGEAIAEKPQLADPASCGRGIAWLRDAGLLIRSDSKPLMPERVPQAAARRAGVPGVASKGVRWQDMQPDGRIPVYFTPHMENHYPLALGMISAAIAKYRDGELLKKFQLMPITYLTPKELFSDQYGIFGPGVWLFSNYMWSLDINLKITDTIKTRDSRNLTIHGGPSTPGYPQACSDFMSRNRSIDIAVHGEGEVAVAELLECIQRAPDGTITFDAEPLSGVEGLTFRSGASASGLHTTSSRTRVRDLDSMPSPYLTGVFDSYGGTVEAAIIESNRGCPFGCTFCDWGSATKQKVRKFDLDRVKGEVDWIGRNGVRVIWIADANFGMFDRDIELSQFIVETKKKYGFPMEVVVNYTKNTTRRLVEIIKVFSAGGIISQGIISIQTTDQATLEVINRKNIKTEIYDELTTVFKDANLPLSTDLMIGLPGITPVAFDRDLQRYFDVDVSTKAYPTQLLPNSPMADPEYMEKYQIRVDENDFIISCHSFNESELAGMKAIYNLFMIADGYSTLRYVLRYLQWEKGIPALEFLHKLLDEVNLNPERYPAISWAVKFFASDKFMPGGWKAFYDEIAVLAEASYGIQRDSAFETVLLANELAMPDNTIDYPLSVPLEHDIVRWFRLNNKPATGEASILSTYPPGTFSVDDPDSLASIDMDYMQYDSHQYFWELSSAMARAKSVSDVKHLSSAAAAPGERRASA